MRSPLGLIAGREFDVSRRVAGDEAPGRLRGPAVDGVDHGEVVVDRRALESVAGTAIDEHLPLEVLDLGGDTVAEPLAERELVRALRQQRVVERMAVAPPGSLRVATATATLADRAILHALAPASRE